MWINTEVSSISWSSQSMQSYIIQAKMLNSSSITNCRHSRWSAAVMEFKQTCWEKGQGTRQCAEFVCLFIYLPIPEAGTHAQFRGDVQQVIVGQIQCWQMNQLDQTTWVHPIHLVITNQQRLQRNNLIEDFREELEPVVSKKLWDWFTMGTTHLVNLNVLSSIHTWKLIIPVPWMYFRDKEQEEKSLPEQMYFIQKPDCLMIGQLIW